MQNILFQMQKSYFMWLSFIVLGTPAGFEEQWYMPFSFYTRMYRAENYMQILFKFTGLLKLQSENYQIQTDTMLRDWQKGNYSFWLAHKCWYSVTLDDGKTWRTECEKVETDTKQKYVKSDFAGIAESYTCQFYYFLHNWTEISYIIHYITLKDIKRIKTSFILKLYCVSMLTFITLSQH